MSDDLFKDFKFGLKSHVHHVSRLDLTLYVSNRLIAEGKIHRRCYAVTWIDTAGKPFNWQYAEEELLAADVAGAAQ